MSAIRDEMLVLKALGAEIYFAKNHVLWEGGDAASTCLLLLEGAVSIETSPLNDGTGQLIAMRYAGEVVGEMSLFTKIRSARVVAIEPVRALEFKHQVLMLVAQENPSLSLALLALSYEKTREMMD